MAETQINYTDRLIVWLQSNWRLLLLGGLLVAFAVSVVLYLYQRQEQYYAAASIAYANLLEPMDRYNNSNSQENTDALIAQIEMMREKFPDTTYTYYAELYMIRILVESQRYEEALDLVGTMLATEIKEDMRAFLILNQAQIMYAMGAPNEAMGILDAADSDFLSPAYLELRGDIYHQREDYSRARSQYTRAMELYEEKRVEPPISLRLKIQIIQSEVVGR